MTVDEWRVLERSSHDARHEYIDGHVYAMSGGSLSHGRMGSNAVRVLEDALASAGQPCFVYNSDVAVRVSPTRYTYPDASISCDERDQPGRDRTEVVTPCLIVEVLSTGTEAYDRGDKFGYYRACPHIREYVLVSTRYQAVEVYTRTPEAWTYRAYSSGDQIELASLAVRVPVVALYRGAGVPEQPREVEGEV